MLLGKTGVTLNVDFAIVSLALLLGLYFFNRSRIPKGLRLPPGPRGKLIIGNVGDMPTYHEWETYSQWAKSYGDLVYVRVLGQSMVFVNSFGLAYELFEKRSSIYSDRCAFPMINDLMGWDWNPAFMRYGEWWRRHRKMLHQKFNPIAAAEYHPIQERHTRVLLQRIYECPDDFVEHLRHTAGSIIMEIVYGIKVHPQDDPYIETAEKAMAALGIAGNAGSFLVDLLPILKYVPEWFPGAGFRKKAKAWRESTVKMSVAPFEAVKEALRTGTAKPSYTSSLLEDMVLKGTASPGEEDVIRGSGASLYAAGADTTVSSLHTFILTMVLFPEIQRKAQEELDEVVGPNRLPQFEDRESLLYVEAIRKEVLRWHPLLPLAVAHRVTQDDIIGDYFIPAGTIVFGNSWEILHDEAVYGMETNKFKPERFLVSGVNDPNAAFGYGRRICAGRYLADSSMFLAMACILKAFDITPAKDSSGKEIPISVEFTSGFFSQPVPFKCEIKPRSDSAKKLIVQGDSFF